MMNGIPDTIFSLNPMKNAATTAGISKEEFAPSLMNLMLHLRMGAIAVKPAGIGHCGKRQD